MEKDRKLSTALTIAVFCLTVPVLAALSLYRLGDHYLNGTAVDNEWAPELGTRFETDLAATFYGKTGFVTLNGGVRRLLGQREMNGVVKLDNGMLAAPRDDIAADAVCGNAASVITLNDYLAKQGVPLLYVIAPCSVDPEDPQLPAGVNDTSNASLDLMAQQLQAAGVATLDLRRTMREDGVDPYSLMFRTDHHWTIRGGFYAFGKITGWLQQTLGCAVDPQVLDPAAYTSEVYPAWHLGSCGQRVGRWFAGVDDFELLWPRFATSMSRNGVNGVFDTLTYDGTPLEKRELTSRSTYDAVLAPAMGNFGNELAQNDVKLLFLADSFGRAVAPFLNLAFAEVHSETDLVQGSELLEYQPDAVVLVYYVGTLVTPDSLYFILPGT